MTHNISHKNTSHTVETRGKKIFRGKRLKRKRRVGHTRETAGGELLLVNSANTFDKKQQHTFGVSEFIHSPHER